MLTSKLHVEHISLETFLGDLLSKKTSVFNVYDTHLEESPATAWASLVRLAASISSQGLEPRLPGKLKLLSKFIFVQ